MVRLNSPKTEKILNHRCIFIGWQVHSGEDLGVKLDRPAEEPVAEEETEVVGA